MNSTTPKTERVWKLHQKSPNSDAACPWGLATRLEKELNKAKQIMMEHLSQCGPRGHHRGCRCGGA